jgi:hypothetical protein
VKGKHRAICGSTAIVARRQLTGHSESDNKRLINLNNSVLLLAKPQQRAKPKKGELNIWQKLKM